MKYYIQFYTRLLNGEIDEAIGSDSVCPLDGRLSLENMSLVGYEQAHSLRLLHTFTGFKIMGGDRLYNGRPISMMYDLEERK